MRKIISLLTIIALFTSLNPAFNQSHPAQFVWKNKTGKGINEYVYFRKDFILKTIPDKAEINLFADSRYILFVNGHLINFGPVRCFPENPEFDTYNIAPYLHEGNNVIGVQALTNGVYTYQMPLSVGGFIAWGKLDKIDFSTPGDWKYKEVKGYHPHSPKFSFAKGPMEEYDGRIDDPDWNQPGTDTKGWNPVIIMDTQNHWGKFRERSMPHLTQLEILPKHVMGIYSFADDETMYSFRIKGSDEKKIYDNINRNFAYTYIYSDKDQSVDVGLWWSEYWLNGDSVKTDFMPDDRAVHSIATLELKKGWNHFFMKYGMVWGIWDFYLAVPNSANLVLSADKDKNSDVIFMTAGPFLPEEQEKINDKNLSLPLTNPDDLPLLSKGWTPKTAKDISGNPAWEIAWQKLGEPKVYNPSEVTNIEINDDKGTSIVLDMGGKLLGRICLDVEAPEGTVFDIGFAEDMRNEKRVNVLKRAGICSAIKYTTKEGHNHFESFKPYGIRFIQLNVSGNNGKPVKINKISVINQVYPFEKTGSFECSDPMFNAIWELGWRTLVVCSEDTYTDTPFRERGTYAGDALPEVAITLATTGDPQLAKRSLYFFMDKYRQLFYPGTEKPIGEPKVLTDFPFITCLFYGWYVDWTNDLEFAKELYPAYKNLIEAPMGQRLENGLYDNGHCFIEWTQIKRDETLTAVQALYVQSLKTMVRMAKILGHEKDADRYQMLANEIIEIIKKECWVENKGAYRDGFYKEGNKPIDNYYPTSSAWPSLYGITTPEQEAKLRPFFMETLSDIGDKSRHRLATPYGGFYQLGSLYKHGNADIAEMFIRKYWSPMILKHNDTAWENFDDGSDGGGQGTLSHAWSGGPTFYMTTEILGIPLGFPEPIDWKNMTFRPQTESITWAKGKVPHPNGIITVSWKIVGNCLYYNCSVPEGVKFNVKPRGKLAKYKLFVNGEEK